MSDVEFRALWFFYAEDTKPTAFQAGFKESYQAVDWIEAELLKKGIPGDSFGKVFFGNEPKPHHYVYFMETEDIGIQNTKSAQWPVTVEEGDGRNMADDFNPEDWGAAASDVESLVDLLEDEIDGTLDSDADAEPEMEDDDDEDDDDIDVEDHAEEGDGEAEIDEGGTGDTGDDDESDDDESDDSDDADDEADEKEPPVIFAKMRGPKAWRKRAETHPEKPVSLFKFVLGILSADETLTPAKREADRQVTLEFRQKGDEGTLKIRIPSYAELKEISPGVYTATIDLEDMSQ